MKRTDMDKKHFWISWGAVETRGLQFLLMLSVLLISDCQKLSINPKETQFVDLGSSAILTCELTDFDIYRGQNPVVRWRNNNNQWVRDTSGRVHIEKESIGEVKLYMSDIAPGDAGLYHCQADVNGQTLVKNIRIAIFEEMGFADTPTYLQQIAGSSPLLECNATGQPEPEISWRFQRRKIPKQDDDKYRYERTGLRIFNIDAWDNGTYECRAERPIEANFVVRTITLEVLYPPIIERGPTSQEVTEGDDVRLACEAHANPEPSYQWYQETPLTNMAKLKRPLLNSDSAIYTVKSISKKDQGDYFCSVTNQLGTLNSGHANVVVNVPPQLTSLPDKRVTEGQTLIIPCETTGSPVPELTWIKEGSKREYDHNSQPHDPNIKIDSAQAGMSKLTIYEASRSYSGQYTCIARNKAGSTNQTSQVTVEYKPTSNISVSELLGWSGQVRQFSCSARGLPTPTISWVKGGQPLFNSSLFTVIRMNSMQGREVITTSILKVNIDDFHGAAVYGQYECVSKNTHGDVKKNMTLARAAAPVKPTNMTVLETSTEGVVIACAFPVKPRPPITMWYLDYFPESEPENVTHLQFDGSEEKFEVGDLEAGQDYEFALSATNAVGMGEALKFKVKTDPELTNQEQSDLPIVDRGDNVNNYWDAAKGDEVKVDKTQTAPEKSSPAEAQVNLINIVGIIVGIAVIFLLLIFILIVMRRRRKKQGDQLTMRQVVEYGGTQTVHVTSDVDPDDLQLNIITHESYSGKGSLMRSPLDSRRANGAYTGTGTLTRKHNRKASDTLLSQDGRGSEQAKLWEDTLQRQRHHISDEAIGEGECANNIMHYQDMTLRTNPMINSTHSAAISETEWPPPPSPETTFTLSRSGHHGYGAALQCADSQSYHAVLDGYMSGENVDDDLPDDDFDDDDEFVVESTVTSPISSIKTPSDFGRVPSDYEQSSYRCYDPIS